jgi:hypothetical protein
MSTQRTYQLKHKALGLCALCPRRAINKSHCKRHRDAARARAKAGFRAKNPNAKPRQCHGCLGWGHNIRTCTMKGAAR